MAKHANRRIDVADACLLAIATELGVGEILTLDSGFRVYRWAGDRPFQILPA